MKSLNLISGNYAEKLVYELANLIKTPLSSPFAKEIIVVQSKGMERWLSLELARINKICANIEFPFPDSLISNLFELILGHDYINLPSLYDPHILKWRIMKLLSNRLSDPRFRAIKNYLEGGSSVKEYQLCAKLAELFNNYLVFRPFWIEKWEKEEPLEGNSNWQAILWRDIVSQAPDKHKIELAKIFFREIEKKASLLPQRISVFGISSLCPFYIDFFDKLSQFTEINIFFISPCKEYWGDLPSKSERKKILARAKTCDEKELYLGGNSLLSSMGVLGRDFLSQLQEIGVNEQEVYHDPGDGSILNAIKSDILYLREPPFSDKRSPDKSIQIHSCHSPMREVEVLFDNILKIMDSDPEISPKDILVMTPDIHTYAPYIQAVFDLPKDDPSYIPFSIADRGLRPGVGLIDAYLEILGLDQSRYSASSIISILETPCVCAKFDISAKDIDMIKMWVKNTRICWGIDHNHKKNMGLPEIYENTWKAGIERLVLGYAMPGKGEKLFDGILPYDGIEGSQAIILGKFLDFLSALFLYGKKLKKERTLSEWKNFLIDILDSFFIDDEESEREIYAVRDAVANLGEIERLSEFDRKIDLSLISFYLEDSIEKIRGGFGFITGGITFCAMLPMRSIPVKVLCMIGINHDNFPGTHKPPGFDLMAQNPERGDRTAREDDKYLFLEAIISAGKYLYISYVGQSIQDKSQIPPSVLVSELLDYIDKRFEFENSKDARENLVQIHKLQAFNPEYFRKSSPFFSYSKENFKSAKALLRDKKEIKPFISKEIPPDQENEIISIDEICRFLKNPAKFFLNKRLDIFWDEYGTGEEVIEEKEPFEIDGLLKYQLENILVDKIIADEDIYQSQRWIKARGDLPHGVMGECAFESLCSGAENFAGKIADYIKHPCLEPLEIKIDVSKAVITGYLGNIFTEHLIFYRCANIKAYDLLKAWVSHLAMITMAKPQYPDTTFIIGRDKSWKYSPLSPKTAKKILTELTEIYIEGLTRPISFFPYSSFAYAAFIIENGEKYKQEVFNKAKNKAKKQWESWFYSGEEEDINYKRCFGHKQNPLDEEFCEVSLKIFGPACQNMEPVK